MLQHSRVTIRKNHTQQMSKLIYGRCLFFVFLLLFFAFCFLIGKANHSTSLHRFLAGLSFREMYNFSLNNTTSIGWASN